MRQPGAISLLLLQRDTARITAGMHVRMRMTAKAQTAEQKFSGNQHGEQHMYMFSYHRPTR